MILHLGRSWLIEIHILRDYSLTGYVANSVDVLAQHAKYAWLLERVRLDG